MRRSFWLFIGSVVLGATLIGLGALYLRTQHTFAGAVIEPPTAAADFSLTGGDGQTVTLGSLRGQWVALFFGYASCPDICPATMAVLRQARSQLGPAGEQLRVVFVSVDPERDPPAAAAAYAARFDPSFIGLSGTPEAVDRVARAYGVKYARVESTSALGYLVSHSSFVYLIDPEFRLRLTYPFGVRAEEVAGDLQFLFSKEAP